MPRLSRKKRGGSKIKKRTKKGGYTTVFRDPTSTTSNSIVQYRSNNSDFSPYDDRNKFVIELRSMMNNYSDKIIGLTAGDHCIKKSNDADFPGFICKYSDKEKTKIKKKIETLLDPIIENLENLQLKKD